MNWLDIIIALILIIAIIIGVKNGLIKTALSLVGLFVAIWLAGRFYLSLAEKLTFIASPQVATIAAYSIIFIIVILGVAMIAWGLTKLVSTIMLGWLNGLGGAFLGLLVGCLFVGAVLVLWAKYVGSGNTIANSMLGRLLVDRFPLVLALLPSEFGTIKGFFR